MNFIGTGIRLQPGDVGKVARSIGVETAVLLAFMEVEANGRGFDGRNRLKILPEPHKFWSELGPGAARDRAASSGLAYPRWGTKPYPKSTDDRYAQLTRMSSIDEDAALRATSWGLPQILGSNCVKSGYGSAKAMVQAMMQSEANQLQAIANFLVNTGIAKHLVGKDFTDPDSWRPAVSRYNGAGYEKNNYHTKCATAYVKHSAGKNDMVETKTSLLTVGMKGELVLNMQKDLIAAGYNLAGGADGRFGPGTEATVRQFQADHKLSPVDGKFGKDSAAALRALLAAARDDGDPEPPKWEGQEPDPRAELAEIRRDLDALVARIAELEAIVNPQKEA